MHCTECVGGQVVVDPGVPGGYSWKVNCEECSGTGFQACPRCSQHNERREGADSCIECAKYVAAEARKLLRELEEDTLDDSDAQSDEAQRAFRGLLAVIQRIERRYDLNPLTRAA
jgi:methylphosphotriester-DNA--protein-cysteine methyltransferase